MDKGNYNEQLVKKVNQIALDMEKMKIAEYVQLLENPRRLLFVNFISGLARGVGAAIGFTVLGALLLYFLKLLVMLNLPLIGDFIAEVVRMVHLKL